ncbi:hypothetical protein N7489_006438, partial [Penicillium chrysogenum]
SISAQLGSDVSRAAWICSLSWSPRRLIALWGYLGYVSMARTQYTIDVVALSQEHCTSRLSNLVDTKNKSSRRARQLQSIAGGNPPGEAARLICYVPIPLLSSLWIKNGQAATRASNLWCFSRAWSHAMSTQTACISLGLKRLISQEGPIVSGILWIGRFPDHDHIQSGAFPNLRLLSVGDMRISARVE